MKQIVSKLRTRGTRRDTNLVPGAVYTCFLQVPIQYFEKKKDKNPRRDEHRRASIEDSVVVNLARLSGWCTKVFRLQFSLFD